ncbi:MAG: NAD(+)/NADH kinase [Huintestinicola sp.]|uniref:NAD(+)/NADH kinase n=1 Tax=Huintestinicola sp. TaxID=2981661 RepID=UPI003F00ADF5
MKTVIYPNFSKKNAYETTGKVCSMLHNMGFEIFCGDNLRERFPVKKYVKFMPLDEAAEQCDLIIAVGGDGTILEASAYAAENDKLLLGINTGRLGFMASMEPDELYNLSRLMSGDYVVENRMMLDCEFAGGGRKDSFTALNDIVISSQFGRLADYFVEINGSNVSTLRADGVIFSTPTGSTAYALSAGGPILEPGLECIQMTPVCPHSLVSRTMLFSTDKKLEVTFRSKDNTPLYLSIDGQVCESAEQDDRLVITRSRKSLRLIDIQGNSFFNAVNKKLLNPIKDI